MSKPEPVTSSPELASSSSPSEPLPRLCGARPGLAAREGFSPSSPPAPRRIILNSSCSSPRHPPGAGIARALPEGMEQRVWETQGSPQWGSPASNSTLAGSWDEFPWMHPVQAVPFPSCQFWAGLGIFVYFLNPVLNDPGFSSL